MSVRHALCRNQNGQKAWGDYGNFYREVIHAIKSGSKNYAIMAHEATELNEQAMQMESFVPVKGAVGKIGVEAGTSPPSCPRSRSRSRNWMT